MGDVRLNLRTANPNDHFAILRELDRISHQIDEHLPQPAGITQQPWRDIRRNIASQFQLFPMGGEGNCFECVFDRFPDPEFDQIEIQLARLDLLKIQDVTDHD
jgi:hypothetical protein